MEKPVGSTAVVRIYSDEFTADGGLAAGLFVRKGQDEFPVSLKGRADFALTRSLLQTGESYGLELQAPGFRLTAGRKKGRFLLDNDAAAGALIKASSGAPVILALIEGFWCL